MNLIILIASSEYGSEYVQSYSDLPYRQRYNNRRTKSLVIRYPTPEPVQLQEPGWK